MTDEERTEIGKRIKEFLEENQATQTDLARDLFQAGHVPTFEAAQVKISRIINGQFEMDYSVQSILYSKYRANIGYILTGKGKHFNPPF